MAPKQKQKNKSRPKIALVSLTACEGCYVECLGLREKFIELKDFFEIVEFRLFEDDHFFTEQKLDAAFVEGSPITKENISNLKKLRKNTKVIIAMGSCAHIGGIYHLKNYYDKEKLMTHIYGENKKIDNFEVKPLSEYVKVDYSLPQCPVNAEEFLRFAYQISIGKKPTIVQNPVCYECVTKGYECLLQKGEICLGPITQGGCNAVCLKSKQACWGCRGLLEKPQIKNWLKVLKEKHKFSQKEINKVLQVFGIKDLVEAFIKRQDTDTDSTDIRKKD